MSSCGDNQLIDHLNKVDGNQVKIRQAVDSCVGIRILLLKKNSFVMSKALMLYLGGKKWRNRVHVFVLYTRLRCFIDGILSFTCIGVLWDDLVGLCANL